MTPDTITTDRAYDLDLEWENAGRPANMLRCVTHRTAGNGSRTFLTIPGDDEAPVYQWHTTYFEHVSGPTLDEWQGLMALQAEYRDANETQRGLLQF